VHLFLRDSIYTITKLIRDGFAIAMSSWNRVRKFSYHFVFWGYFSGIKNTSIPWFKWNLNLLVWILIRNIAIELIKGNN